MNIGIIRYGAYLPKYLLERKLIAEAWDFPVIPGGIAVRNYDEDSITMAVEACLDCLGEYDPNGMIDVSKIDGIYFASTTPPYTEKQCAPIIANAIDLRSDIISMDITDSTRGMSSAMARAYETIKAGKANLILVVGADAQKPMPESMYEYQYGDGAAAVLIGKNMPNDGFEVIISIEDYISTSDNVIGPWKRAEDKFVRSFEAKHENIYGYTRNIIAAFKMLFEKAKVDPKAIAKAAIYAPDPRKAMAIGKKLGIASRVVENSPFLEFGNTGNAFAVMTLLLALKRGKTGDLIAFGSYGDGADAFLLKVLDKQKLKELKRKCRGVIGYKNTMIPLKNYGGYLSKKKLLETERFTRKSSPVRNWRDEKFLYRMYGMKCNKCGTIQYPIWRACIECGEKDNKTDVKLKKTGKIYTFTLDHLEGGNYYDTPVPRCVIDLDGGGRILLNMTDIESPQKNVKIGMDVEMTFRFIHPGANYNNYYWKCRPIRVERKKEEGNE
ncbi:MAG: OB-fold domain-containing protein [Promethearchaeota archaeon]